MIGPPFQPWTIRRNDNGFFDLYGGSDHMGRPWRRPHILARDLDPTLAAWLAETNIVEPSFAEAIRIWRSEKGLDNEASPLLKKAETLLLAAGHIASTGVIDEAFNAVFDLVQEARKTGDVTDCNEMLGWATSNAYALHPEALLPCVRLTCNMREYLDNWLPLLGATRAVIVERGENADNLLCGLEGATKADSMPTNISSARKRRSAAKRKRQRKNVRQRVWNRDGRRCPCGATEMLTVDHIWPLSRDGCRCIDNLQTMCADCNERKGSRLQRDASGKPQGHRKSACPLAEKEGSQ